MKKLQILSFFLVMKICSLYLSEQRLGSRSTDFNDCTQKDANLCSDVKFTEKGFQCCKFSDSESPKCNIMVSPIKSAQDEANSENGKILYKEYFGYYIFNAESPENFASEIQCEDGNLNFKYEVKDYTSEQQEKFKSQKHCLFYNAEPPEEITKNLCYNADLATTGNSGISCGYFELDIVMTDNSKVKQQTCFLFNDDIRTTKNLGYSIKQMAEEVALNVARGEGKELLSYQMTGTNSKEKSFIYYSVNDTVSIPIDPIPTDTDTSDTTDGTKPNISKFINSGYILLLILFYILSY